MSHDTIDRRSRVRGCLLGGAIGDALGAPTEFLSLGTIRSRWPPDGVNGFEPAYGLAGGAITDDTQMTLFTAEVMIEAARARLDDDGTVEATRRAYLRWLTTQRDWSRSSACTRDVARATRASMRSTPTTASPRSTAPRVAAG